MSALNHAFLRAYAKERTTTRRTDMPAAEAAPVIPVQSLPVVAPLNATVVADRPRSPDGHPLYAPRHDAPPPTRPMYGFRMPRTAEQVPGHSPPAARTPGLATRRVPHISEFVPAWEVDAFQWPHGCQLAWDGAGDEFAALGEQLVTVNQHGLRVLGVTSGTRQEGHSTLAMCLARAAADQNLRVLLLDADLDNPQLAGALGVDVRHDWTEVLSEALPLEETAIASIADRITLIPLVAGAAGRGNLLRLPLFAQFAEQLAAACDLVVVDLPPLDSNSLPLARSGNRSPLDATLVVRDVRHTNVDRLRDTLRRLESAGASAVGVIENFV